MNVNVYHNEPPLTTLVDQWQALKQAEEDARLARVAHEAPVSYTHLTLPTNREV